MIKNQILKPTTIPGSPYFCSGPTKKRPGYSSKSFDDAMLSRTHRCEESVSILNDVCERTRRILGIPKDFKVMITPGSATGAMETGLWNLLGEKPVDIFTWDGFGQFWVRDVIPQLKIEDNRIFNADFGELPDLGAYDKNRDCVFVYNGTAAGVCVPGLDWISTQREALTFCDATSAAFCFPFNWDKLDVTAFSWQKGLGGEAAHGMLVLSPRALERLRRYTPSWPIPIVFALKRGGVINESLFQGWTINTPSMLCVHDFRESLIWAEEMGGLKGLYEKTLKNYQVLEEWIQSSSFVRFIAGERSYRSPVSVTFVPKDHYFKGSNFEIVQFVSDYLAQQGIAYDISNNSLAPPSFRVWCGPTIDTQDISALVQWFEYLLSQCEEKDWQGELVKISIGTK